MNLLEALEVIRAPCDDCFFYPKCATERLACNSFRRFVDGESRWGTPTNPTRALFEEIAKDDS